MWWHAVGYFRGKKLRLERAMLYRRIALGATFVFACLYMLGELDYGYSSHLYLAGWSYAFAVFFLMRVPYESLSARGYVVRMFTPLCTLLAGLGLGWVLR